MRKAGLKCDTYKRKQVQSLVYCNGSEERIYWEGVVLTGKPGKRKSAKRQNSVHVFLTDQLTWVSALTWGSFSA